MDNNHRQVGIIRQHAGVELEIAFGVRRAGEIVAARQEGIDPVGCCVGLRGIRIQNIVNELNGEKIDVIQWHPDTAIFVTNALSPAQIQSVELNEKDKIATVIVSDRQLSLAIGKEGQNARLAAKLTGLRIDIKSAAIVEAERLAKAAPAVKEAEVEETAEAEAVVEEAPQVVEAIPVIEEASAVKATEPVAGVGEPVPVFFQPKTAEKKAQLRFAEDTGVKKSVEVEGKVKKKKKSRKETAEEAARSKGRRRREEIVIEEDEQL